MMYDFCAPGRFRNKGELFRRLLLVYWRSVRHGHPYLMNDQHHEGLKVEQHSRSYQIGATKNQSNHHATTSQT